MTTTTVKAPIHLVRTKIAAAATCTYNATSTNGPTRAEQIADATAALDVAISEAEAAHGRVGNAFAPAALVLSAALHGAKVARTALEADATSEALGGLRATLSALESVPVAIEAPGEGEGPQEPEKVEVHGVVIEHRYGTDAMVFRSEEEAWAQLVDWVKHWWSTEFAQTDDIVRPEDDSEAVRMYFEHTQDESYTLFTAEV